MDYPRRESHYAHRLVRILAKSCAVNDIGHQAAWLVAHIAHTEDAARYSGPVRFWNSQLMETCGFNCRKSLERARQKAIDAGWLIYERQSDRTVGLYMTAIPEVFQSVPDNVIEPVCATPETQKLSQNLSHECLTSSPTNVSHPVSPSNPIPIPSPNPVVRTPPPDGGVQQPKPSKPPKPPKAEASKPDDVSQSVWDDFLVLRKTKRAPLTQTALNSIAKEAQGAGVSLERALVVCCERGWQGFRGDWYKKDGGAPTPVAPKQRPLTINERFEQRKRQQELEAQGAAQ